MVNFDAGQPSKRWVNELAVSDSWLPQVTARKIEQRCLATYGGTGQHHHFLSILSATSLKARTITSLESRSSSALSL